MRSVGILGCGLIGHKRGLAALSCGDSVGGCFDLNKEAAARVSSTFRCRVFDSPEELLRDESIDLVVVATYHSSLKGLVIQALDAGKHVLVEKPAAVSLSDIDELIEAENRSPGRVKVGFNYRFHPAIMMAKQLLDDGVIGEVMWIRGHHGHGARVGYDREWRCQREISGGGEMVDQGSHLVDLAGMFAGKLALQYSSLSAKYWPIEVEDNCFLALESESSATVWLHASWTEWKNNFSLEITGRVGKLQIDGFGGSYGTERLTLYKMSEKMGPPDTSAWEFPQPDQSWDREYEHFLSSIETGQEFSGGLGEAREVWRVIEQAYSSQDTLKG